MKIVIAGVTGFRNRGVEALVVPIIDWLIDRYSPESIQIASWSPDYDSKRYTAKGVTFVKDCFLQDGCWHNRVTNETQKAAIEKYWGKLKRKFGRMTRTVGQMDSAEIMPFDPPDILVVSGGDLFSSDYGTESLRHFAKPITWAKSKGVPCILVGQSVGKFKLDVDSEIWRTVLAEASAITLREFHSFHYLRDELNSLSSKISVTADTAFLLKPDQSIVKNCEWFKSGPVVGISVSESICKWTGGDYEEHFRAWQRIVRHMIDQWGVRIAIIPHVHESYSDDRVLATRIARGVGFDSRIRVFAEDLAASEYKGIISQCEFLVAERMHAAIAGFSSGVCTVPIEYSIKAKGVAAAMVDGSEFQADDVVIPLVELLDIERTLHRLDGLWQSRKRLGEIIGRNLPAVVTRAESNFKLLETFLSSQHRPI